MKKHSFLISFALLFCINMVFTDSVKSQWIINLNIDPANPTSMDNITLATENMFSSGDCWLDSSSFVINGYDIQLDAYFSTGALAVICTSYDTFQLGQLSDGTYQLHYNLRHPSSPNIEDSATIVFTVGSVGIEEKHNTEKESVYPNPTSGKLFLKDTGISDTDIIVFRIFTLQGQEMKSLLLDGGGAELEIDISDLSPAFYLYEYHIKGSQLYKSGKMEVL